MDGGRGRIGRDVENDTTCLHQTDKNENAKGAIIENHYQYACLHDLQLVMIEPKTSPSPISITIIGAGVSGLVAAISCALAGHKVVVLEGAKELAEVRKWPIPSIRYNIVQLTCNRSGPASKSRPTAPRSSSNLASTLTSSPKPRSLPSCRCGGTLTVRCSRAQKPLMGI